MDEEDQSEAVGTVSLHRLQRSCSPRRSAYLPGLGRVTEAPRPCRCGGCALSPPLKGRPPLTLTQISSLCSAGVGLILTDSMPTDTEAPLGSIGNPVRFKNQDFQTLLEQCVKAGELFSDPTFPAEQRSISLPDDPDPNNAIKWLRPKVDPNQNPNQDTVGPLRDRLRSLQAVSCSACV